MTTILKALAVLLLLVVPTPASAMYFFDGVDDSLSYAENGRLEELDTTQQITVCFSLQVHRVVALHLITKTTNTSANGWGIVTGVGATDDLAFIITGQSGRVVNGAQADGVTRRYCYVWDGTATGNVGRLRIYTNGVYVTPTFSGTIQPSITTAGVVLPLCLAASGVACGTSEAPVYLGHVRIWTAALNSDEIALERFTYNPTVRPESLVFWAPLDDEHGTNFAGEGRTDPVPTKAGSPLLDTTPGVEDPEIVKP